MRTALQRCVPGGLGVIEAMGDAEYVRELRRLAAGARDVTSVCPGSLLSGAAGLLRGKRRVSSVVARSGAGVRQRAAGARRARYPAGGDGATGAHEDGPLRCRGAGGKGAWIIEADRPAVSLARIRNPAARRPCLPINRLKIAGG
ncbi:hypothetical protein [Burkholderia sp.]|jgi:hypothetical protein|uniref:hypothetical protein n=1 Tax=Burkholderia sp. TaxID=36773 RepID=UPI0035E257E8